MNNINAMIDRMLFAWIVMSVIGMGISALVAYFVLKCAIRDGIREATAPAGYELVLQARPGVNHAARW